MSSSPRSSALARAKDSRRCHDGVHDLTHRLAANILPVLLLAAVVVSAVIAWLVGSRYEAVAVSKGWAEVFRYGTLAGVALLAILGVTAWVTAHAYMHSDPTYRMVLLAIFVGVSVVLGLALYFFFCRNDRTVAFYLTVVAVLAVLVHTYLCWRAMGLMGVVGMVPAVVLGAYLLYRFWPEELA